MKTTILTVLCVMGLATVAKADYQVVYNDYDQVLGVGAEGIALNNACITDTEVKSIAPVKVCTNLVPIEHKANGEEQAYTDWVCQSYALQNLSSSRAFTRMVCDTYERATEASAGGCLHFTPTAETLPATIKISTVTVTGGEVGDNFPGVQSTFTFPACK